MARGTKRRREAKRVAVMGLLPRAGYRAKVMPLAPAPMLHLRHLAGAYAGGVWCLTAALLLELGPRGPSIALPMATVRP